MSNDALFLKWISQIEYFKNVPKQELHELFHVIHLITVEEDVAYYFESIDETHYIISLTGRLLILHDNLKHNRPFSVKLPQGAFWPLRTNKNLENAIGVQALSKGKLGILSSCELQQLFCKTTQLRLAIFQSMGISWQYLTEAAFRKITLNLVSQLARLLLDFKQNVNGQLIVPLSHFQLALLLNSHRETISRELQKMKSYGWIDTKRKEIILLDPEMLQIIGEGKD